ncbi:MAG: DUF1501 domain-containing protein [Cytophagales bacterium]|nr:DUF1501 domain-containing protein [Bernardetiaceae bacterium]MDW8204564.1 DUF1501 domain-containing protein [Cytophagales bacterium]
MASRREFIHQSSLAVVGTMLAPAFLKVFEKNLLQPDDKILVVIQLSGGNDGLNTVVPFRNDIYYSKRQNIAIAAGEALKISDELALNPAMEKFRRLYDEGWVSIVNSVGYPNPDRSHFRSMDIWHTASHANEYLNTGWLGRYLDAQCTDTCHAYRAIEIDDTLSLVLKGAKLKGLALQDPQKFYQAVHSPIYESIARFGKPADPTNEHIAYLYKTIAETSSSADYIYQKTKVSSSYAEYPNSQLARRLKTVAELIQSGVQTRVYYLSLSGFDTHVRQIPQQNRLLSEYSEAIYAFVQHLRTIGKHQQVAILTFSEFGRRVAQNASNGTDHGAANCVFLIGTQLKKSGIVNAAPDLSDLDDGDLKHRIDFRSIYANLVENWLQADPTAVLGRRFEPLSLL